MKREIQNREDLYFLVDEFYKRIRADKDVGDIFNTIIVDWNKHLELITDFWEFQLFKTKNYKGNPIEAHIRVDQIWNSKITPTDFGTWMFHWLAVINEFFEGSNAETLKFKARKMQTILYLKIHESRS